MPYVQMRIGAYFGSAVTTCEQTKTAYKCRITDEVITAASSFLNLSISSALAIISFKLEMKPNGGKMNR